MKILIVDDEPLIRRSLQLALERRGHKVLTAEDGVSGFEKWQSEKPDLVLLDVLMPGLTGPQVMDKMGENHQSKVVLMSAFSGEARPNSKIKPNLFLRKPFEDIFKAVSSIEAIINE